MKNKSKIDDALMKEEVQFRIGCWALYNLYQEDLISADELKQARKNLSEQYQHLTRSIYRDDWKKEGAAIESEENSTISSK